MNLNYIWSDLSFRAIFRKFAFKKSSYIIKISFIALNIYFQITLFMAFICININVILKVVKIISLNYVIIIFKFLIHMVHILFGIHRIGISYINNFLFNFFLLLIMILAKSLLYLFKVLWWLFRHLFLKIIKRIWFIWNQYVFLSLLKIKCILKFLILKLLLNRLKDL
jgi:hypothetical protein